MKIEVQFQTQQKQNDLKVYNFPNPPSNLSFLQRYRYTTALLCQLKRMISQDRKINPLNQHLWFANRSNDFNDVFTSTVFPRLVLTPRNRTATAKITICGWNEDVHELAVDLNDTVLDVKFILGAKLGTQPENLQLVVNFKQRLLNNNENISDAGILSKDPKTVVHYWLECPSNDKDVPNNVVFRSVVNFDQPPPNCPTLGHYFRNNCKKFSNRGHLGTRSYESNGVRGDYVFLTYKGLNERVSNFASGLVSLGLERGGTTRIGICAENRAEWVLADYANHTQSFVTVPLYDTLSKNAIEYIVNHAGVSVVCCSPNTVREVLNAKPKCKTLKYIIIMDSNPPDKEFINKNKNIGFTHTFSQIENIGKNNRVNDNLPKPNDLCTICYTSGTTGDPKGAMITHSNFMTAIGSFIPRVNKYFEDDDDRVLSYLPLAHMYEKLVEALCLHYGAKIGYWQGDVLKLVDDLQALKPTFFAGVPRVYQKFQDKITAQVQNSNFIRRYLFNKAFESKANSILKREEPSAIWEKLVFSKVGQAFGGRIKAALSGSAPLSVSTANFLRVVFAQQLGEGYGLTETVAAGTSTTPDDCVTFGHVGSVSGCVEMKLMDVPDMNYFTTDEPCPRGEIWLRGPTIFEGYYRKPDITNKVLTKDGWFATGDVGQWRLDGKLQIIDRKKNIFKLAQGEYVRPEYIENVYKMSPYIGNIFVHGNSNETYVVAVVFPDPEIIVPWANSNGLKSISNDWNQLCNHQKVRNLIESDMRRLEKQEQLTGFERVRKFYVTNEDFTIENGLLTSTMKLKRAQARDAFKQQIQQLYSSPKQSKL